MAQRQILLTGGSGQVGRALQALKPEGWSIVAPRRDELDLADAQAVAAFAASRPWSAIISSGAYTAVDKAETDVVTAWKVNALAPAALASVAGPAGIPLIQLSTDYVFDGAKAGYYLEDDPVAPLGVYGASKLAGEQAVRTAAKRHLILRTSWVVSPYGSNFVKTMLRIGAERPVLRVVDDQHGCPTSALDIAKALVGIVDQVLGPQQAESGTYHFVNGGEATWCGLARQVFDHVRARGGAVPSVEPITTADYPTPARRPANSRLATEKLERDFAIRPRSWRDALIEVMDALLGAEDQKAKAEQ